ncbi:TVA4 protein, partial [Origma solitaria]|nr:TVA4 protein [Origma solitaria]
FSMAVSLARAQIQQKPSLETPEGTGINISCSHPNIKTNDFIYWFHQLPGLGPELFVSVHKGFKELPDKAGSLSVSADRKSSTLYLSRPRLGDAAVYYCALGT